MRVAIRADASYQQGTGHVMRCLTLARELMRANHSVTLFGDMGGIRFLEDEISKFQINYTPHSRNLIAIPNLSTNFDLLIVDSYEIATRRINELTSTISTCSIIDYDDKQLKPSIFIDQNLGAAEFHRDNLWQSSLQLLGPSYALVRQEIVQAQIPKPSKRNNLSDCKLVCFFGGTDLRNFASLISKYLGESSIGHITVVTNNRELLKSGRTGRIEYIPTATNIFNLVSHADGVISAAGSSVLELGTIGVPACFVLTAENQAKGFEQISNLNIGSRLLNFGNGECDQQSVISAVEELLLDYDLRIEYFTNNRKLFDGKGTERTVGKLESYFEKS